MGAGIDIPSPPSQQGAAGPQAGSHAGAHTGAGAPQGAGCGDPHERNSMNEGRRQLLPPPMQLLQPGAAARLTTAITRHNARAMGLISDTDQTGQAGGSLACGVVIDATRTLPHVSARG